MMPDMRDCPSHSRLRDDVESLRDKLEVIREKVSKISGWQVAISVFISICVALILDASSATRDSVQTLSTYYQELADRQHEIDKQVSELDILDGRFEEDIKQELKVLNERVSGIEESITKR